MSLGILYGISYLLGLALVLVFMYGATRRSREEDRRWEEM